MFLPPGEGSRIFAVKQSAREMHRGVMVLSGRAVPCALGRSGIVHRKQEGDGATPAGLWLIRCIFYRPDRLRRPRTGLACYALTPSDGWCDDPSSRYYNRPVPMPFDGSAEHMWRDDHLYDLVGILAHNDAPPEPGKGSCIFLHLARPDLAATEGCVALQKRDLLNFVETCGASAALRIG